MHALLTELGVCSQLASYRIFNERVKTVLLEYISYEMKMSVLFDFW